MSVDLFLFFFFNDTATTEIYTYCHTLSLHDALPIYVVDASEAASIITSFKLQTGIPLTRAEAAATPTPRAPAASARRAAQIESAAAPRDRKSTRLNSSH